jgi:hypothetical protein
MGFCLENFVMMIMRLMVIMVVVVTLMWMLPRLVVVLLLQEVIMKNQLYVHIIAPQLVSLGRDDMYHPQYVYILATWNNSNN